jgi:hypothetical protein
VVERSSRGEWPKEGKEEEKGMEMVGRKEAQKGSKMGMGFE